MKSSSKLALMAAAGILVGGVSMGSAKAADLGGDCCADLEERVAELEATTARKGNRKVSLTVSGQVDRAILYMRDDTRSRTIAGVDNTISSSRFIFSGNAKVTSSVTAGFELMVEWSGSSRTQDVGQTTTLVHNWAGVSGLAGNASGDGSLAIRTANWYLEDKVLGRVTVGRVNIQGPASIIDISGGDVQLAGWSNPLLQAGGMILSRSGGGFATNTLGQLLPYCYGCSREEGIRYDSASFAGFTFGGFWGEQDVWTAQARYAAEFAGFQIAAGAGYQQSNNLAGFAPTDALPSRTVNEQQAYALSLKHVASGIFAQGNIGQTHIPRAAGVSVNRPDGKMWQIQAGIAKNWFGPGVTAVYGEYGRGENYGANAAVSASTAAGSTMFAPLGGTITADHVNYYGVGMTQKIDAAAMSLYLAWRRYEPTVRTTTATPSLSDIDTVIGGARIAF